MMVWDDEDHFLTTFSANHHKRQIHLPHLITLVLGWVDVALSFALMSSITAESLRWLAFADCGDTSGALELIAPASLDVLSNAFIKAAAEGGCLHISASSGWMSFSNDDHLPVHDHYQDDLYEGPARVNFELSVDDVGLEQQLSLCIKSLRIATLPVSLKVTLGSNEKNRTRSDSKEFTLSPPLVGVMSTVEELHLHSRISNAPDILAHLSQPTRDAITGEVV